VWLNNKSVFHDPERVNFASIENEGPELSLGVGSLDIQFYITMDLRSGASTYEVSSPKQGSIKIKGTCEIK
jgi:hypothetical protein